MTLLVRPKRGGFLRPFGCGWFIREYLSGNAPAEAPAVDPAIGAPQADIFYYYKMALRRATAMDRAVRREERLAKRQKRSISPDNINILFEKYIAKMPYKANGARYHSFVTYFSTLKRLGWVEPSGLKEASSFQDHYPAGKSRIYYRLTASGKSASAAAWSNPHFALYGRGK
jgi:hypothetical protein